MEFNLYNITGKGFIRKRYDVYKANNLVYECRLKIFLSQINMYPLDGSPTLIIKKKFSFLKMNIEIFKGAELLAVLQPSVKIMGYNINVQTTHELLTIEGNIMASAFVIKRGIEEICKISRKATLSPILGIAIVGDEDQQLILSIILALELFIIVKQAGG